VERDSERNLEVFEFVAEHAATEELAWSLLQFVPQLLLMRTRSRGTEALKGNSFEQAVLHIQEGISELERFYQENERLEMMETSPELASLREWLNQVQNRRPLSEKERLERDLAEAIRLEDYERAARVRDQIRKMQASGS
jgi:excinuclease UvrABC helicase subunit UvrB